MSLMVDRHDPTWLRVVEHAKERIQRLMVQGSRLSTPPEERERCAARIAELEELIAPPALTTTAMPGGEMY